jgi:hypothetical protein
LAPCPNGRTPRLSISIDAEADNKIVLQNLLLVHSQNSLVQNSVDEPTAKLLEQSYLNRTGIKNKKKHTIVQEH